MQLLQRCFKCGSKISAKVRLYTSATNLSAKFFCPTSKIVKKWSGQQVVENTEQSLGTLRLIAAANVAPVAYPELSTLLDVAGIAGLSSTTFQRHSSSLVWPVIETKYRTQEAEMFHDAAGQERYLGMDRTESKKKCNEELRSALPRIMNHLYYCASLPKEDPQVIKENALSSLLHLCGIHEWQKNEKFEKVLCCCHPPELSSQNEVLLNPASSAYGVILNVLTSSQFLSDIVKLNGDSSTSYVESFNSIAIIYRLKRKF
uniref:Uncharacterized protein n=1 Tax=Ditylenchus dipsaci TaxID=166011 RepID=A0A915CRE4_9BILA